MHMRCTRKALFTSSQMSGDPITQRELKKERPSKLVVNLPASRNWCADGDYEDAEGNNRRMRSRYYGLAGGGDVVFDEADAVSERSQCMSFESHDTFEQGEDQPGESSELSRQDRHTGSSKLEQHFLRASSVLEDLIEEELDRYRAHYTRPIDLSSLDDVAKFLMPDATPALQLACVCWLGDWRPTAMLALLMGLARSSCSFSDAAGTKRAVSGLIRGARIEEAIIDGEMAEIQATSVLNLPFAFGGNGNGLDRAASASSCIQAELQKFKQVITKAQQLRFKTLETMVRKVPNPSDAAEFLMALEKIQTALHQSAVQHDRRNGEVTFSVKRLGILDST